MKRIIVMGTGAQGSIVARLLDEEPNVSEIICADYELKSAERLEKMLSKAKSVKVDAHNIEEILESAKGAELIVNALPIEFNLTVIEAALQGGMNYQDLASAGAEPVEGLSDLEAWKREMKRMDERFKEAGLIALINAGSAPGLTNLLVRNSVDKLDSCERIDILLYEAVWTKKLIPFWWSPEVAFNDMADEPDVFEDGQFKRVKPFDRSEMIHFKGVGARRMVAHTHEEVDSLATNIKGVKHVRMKMGGSAMEFSESLYKMGLLSREPVEVNGVQVIPLDLILKLAPPAPSSVEEIEAALAEGLELEEGAALVRVEGTKEGKKVRIDNYINAPGLIESLEKYQMSHSVSYSSEPTESGPYSRA
ncbi:hypothetical protein ES703_122380 [subsurface metagenome]